MNFLAHLLLIATVASTTVSAKSFISSIRFRDKKAVINMLTDVCNELRAGGAFRHNEDRHVCWNDSNVTRVEFTIRRIGGGSSEITMSACVDGLRSEITGYEHGERRYYTNWEFACYPNDGQC